MNTKASSEKSADRKRISHTKKRTRKLRTKKRPVFLLIFIAILVFFGLEFPFNRLYNENRSLVALETTQTQLQKSNEQLNRQINQLNTPSQIEKIARQRYGLVKQGEQPYVILPSNSSVSPIPPIPTHLGPNGSVSTSNKNDPGGNFFSRLISRLEFWK